MLKLKALWAVKEHTPNPGLEREKEKKKKEREKEAGLLQGLTRSLTVLFIYLVVLSVLWDLNSLSGTEPRLQRESLES